MAINTDSLLSLLDDQIASQHSIIFPTGIPGGGNTERLSLRCDLTFDPPEEVVNSYDIFHKGFKFTKTGMLQETTKEFTVEIRLDQQWGVYDDIDKWSKMVYDHTNGTSMPEAMSRSTIIVQAEDRNQDSVKQLIYRQAKPKSIKIGSFDNASGDPLRITVTFIYIKMDTE